MTATQIHDDNEPILAVRSFIDLRAFAANVRPPIARMEGGDLLLDSRALLPLAEGPISAGVVMLEGGSGTVETMPADDFLIVLDGALTLDAGGGALSLTAGKSAVLTAGARISWSADAPVTLIFLRRTGGPMGEAMLVPINERAPLEPSGAPLAELLVGPTPNCRNHTDYLSKDGEFVCGTWDSTPYHRLSMPYRHYELMHLLQGSVTFVDEAGRSGTFGEGDIFLLEQGAHCSWESREHVKKVYAIYRPA